MKSFIAGLKEIYADEPARVWIAGAFLAITFGMVGLLVYVRCFQ